MSKYLCKTDKKETKFKPNKEYICEKCNRTSNKKNKLCNPAKNK